MKRAAVAAPILGLAALMASTGPAAAADGSVQGDLASIPVNDVAGSGEATMSVAGTTLTFTLKSQGLLAASPHAAHIHFGAGARHECPTEADNANGDDFLTTGEGAPAYGDIIVSLTNAGATAPADGLAVDRFAVGPDFEYSRADVQVTEEVAASIVSGDSVVVVHGVDHDGDGAYSMGARGPSDLDPTLPGEATDPALCGVLSTTQMSGVPAGGVDTGAGSTSGVENIGLLGAGGVAVVGGLALVARRRLSTDG